MRFHRIFGIVLFLALAPLARGQSFELLHVFQNTEGGIPASPLIQGIDGNFYGTAKAGGSNNYGTVFKMTSYGVVTPLASFNGDNGISPAGRMAQDNKGNFYGVTQEGGAYDLGTCFKITTNGTLTRLVSFNGTNGGFLVSPGLMSLSPSGLIRGSDSNFYGTTVQGGDLSLNSGYGYGTVFRLTTNGILTTLISFNESNGNSPRAGLVQGNDGFLYGTTAQGGAHDYGTAFRMTTNGTLITLVSFTAVDGHPRGDLMQAKDGKFYGTLFSWSARIFRMETNGLFTTSNYFDELPSHAALVQGRDGDLYGTAQLSLFATDGKWTIFKNHGAIFKMTSSGIVTRLISFGEFNGSEPMAGLTQGNDGKLYGTTSHGGFNDNGVIFRISIPVKLNSRVSGNELVLSWPTNALGFTLQSSSDLNSPTNWMDSTNAPAVVGAQFTVTNNLSASAQFYRLKKP